MVDTACSTEARADKDPDKKGGKVVTEKGSPGSVNFGKPQRLDNCRVCGQLEAAGYRNLYDNHTSNFVTGCPHFQAMSAEERRDICIKAKICLKCADPKVIHSARHRFECKVTSKKRFWFTCSQHPQCLQHSWVCGYHKAENKSSLESFSKKFNVKC